MLPQTPLIPSDSTKPASFPHGIVTFPAIARQVTIVRPEFFLTRFNIQHESPEEILKARRVSVLHNLNNRSLSCADFDRFIQTVCEEAAAGKNQLELEALGDLLQEKKAGLNEGLISMLSHVLIAKMATHLKLAKTAESILLSHPIFTTPPYKDSELDEFKFTLTPSWTLFAKSLFALDVKVQFLKQPQLEKIIRDYSEEKWKPQDLEVGFLLLLLFCNQGVSEPLELGTLEVLHSLFFELWQSYRGRGSKELSTIFEKLLNWADKGYLGEQEGTAGIVNFLKGFHTLCPENFPLLIQIYLQQVERYPEVCFWMIQNFQNVEVNRVVLKKNH